jgi:hypothetical protein
VLQLTVDLDEFIELSRVKYRRKRNKEGIFNLGWISQSPLKKFTGSQHAKAGPNIHSQFERPGNVT